MSRDAGTASPLHTALAGLCFGQRYNGKDNNVYPSGAAINGGKQKRARIRGLRPIKRPTGESARVAGLGSQVAREGGRTELCETAPVMVQQHKQGKRADGKCLRLKSRLNGFKEKRPCKINTKQKT